MLAALISAAHAAASPADGYGESAPAPGFFDDPTSWALIGLLIFLALVWRGGGFAAITRQLDARGARIKAELAEAERLRTEAQALLAEYTAKRVTAESEARAIIAQARADADALRLSAKRELDADLARRDRITEERIARAEQQALTEVRAVAADAAIAAAERILTQKLDAGAQRALVADGVAELSKRFA